MLKCSKVKPDEMFSPADLYCWHPDWRAAGQDNSLFAMKVWCSNITPNITITAPDTVLPVAWWIVGSAV